MGRSLADVYVTVGPDMKQFGPQVKKELKKQNFDAEAKKTAKKFSGILSKAVGVGLGGLGAGLALGGLNGLKNAFTTVIAGAQESARVSRVTAAAIKSTGGAANVSAKQVGTLAQAISNKTGADDEAIQSGQNLLLTFTNIKNGVGAGNDIFNQASAAIVDMTASLHNGAVTSEGLKGSSIQLGKALNDPIKGITALSKVGVSFTDQQKEQIKALVKSGHTMDAQKIILKELGKEFGGTAKAAADPMTRLNTIVGNLAEDIGGLLLPYVNKFADWVGNKAVPSLQGFIASAKTSGSSVNNFVTRLGALVGAAKNSVVWLNRNRDVVVAVGAALAIVKLASFTKSVYGVVVATRAWIVAQGGLNLAMRANLFGIVVTAIAAVVAIIIVAYNRSETFRKIVDKTTKGIATGFKFLWNSVLKPIFRLWVSTWLTVVGVIVHGAAKALGWVPGIGPKLKGAAREFDKFKNAVNRSLNNINDEKVNITARFNNHLPRTLYGVRVGGGAGSSRGGITATMAQGGPVNGGVRGVDSVPILAKPGEHVLRTEEVEAAGGHGVIERWRAMLRSGVARFALGGRIDVDSRLNRALGRGANEIAAVSAKAINKALMGAGGGGFNPGLSGGLGFAQRVGAMHLPYIWGGVGPRGYDCSGFMSAILNVVQGRRPYSRRGSTGTFPWPGFAPGPGAFMIGAFQGSPGHMAGTINGVNVESSGSRGPHTGRSARGARDRMFTMLYHLKGYAKGGQVVEGDPPFDLLSPDGDDYRGDTVRRAMLGASHTAMSRGGVLREPVFGYGAATGRSYSFAETGPESVSPTDQISRLHPDDIRALGREMGTVVLAGIGHNNISLARQADRYTRGG
jgi:hypothetical protein